MNGNNIIKSKVTFLNTSKIEVDISSIEDVMNSPLSKFITFVANLCEYNGMARDLMVNWVDSFFLKGKATTSEMILTGNKV